MRGWWILIACVAAAAIAMHVPGELSMDSSLQVYEALTGRSVSWAPPFMSALLRWMGGGPQSTTLFVVICTLATYGGLGLALGRGTGPGVPGVPAATGRAGAWRALRIAAIAILLLNPILFLHVGIVWKDVLFASQLALAMGLMLAAVDCPRWRRWLFAAACLVLLPAPLVRQHGVLLTPLLAAPCLWAITAPREPGRIRRGARLGAMAAATGAYIVLFLLLNAAVQHTIRGAGEKSASVGLTVIARYDLTGMIAKGMPVSRLPPTLRDPAFLAASRRHYSDDRIDFVLHEPTIEATFEMLDDRQLQAAWVDAVAAEPLRYLEVKGAQYAWLIGLHRLDKCLPVHVGVEGNREFLLASGFQPGLDARDPWLYRLSMFTRHFALYRHWFYLVVFAGCVAVLFARRRRIAPPERGVLAAFVLAIAVLYASFGPTVLACDFRYLYPGIVMVSALALHLMAKPALRRTSTDD